MENVWSTFSTGPPRIHPWSPPSGTLSGLNSPVQTAQSAIIGVPVSYRTYRRDTSIFMPDSRFNRIPFQLPSICVPPLPKKGVTIDDSSGDARKLHFSAQYALHSGQIES